MAEKCLWILTKSRDHTSKSENSEKNMFSTQANLQFLLLRYFCQKLQIVKTFHFDLPQLF